jgi:hypothetical protein
VPPVVSIGYEKDSDEGNDSGFSLIFSDAPPADELDEYTPVFLCVNCAVEDYPEVGRGLDLAREMGAADLDENDEWVGRQFPPESSLVAD